MTKTFRIAVIAGDGIGPEVIAEVIRVADSFNHRIQKFAMKD